MNAATGAETGLEVVRQVFPKLGMVPGILLAPRFSKDPMVCAALQAKCRKINGVFDAVCFVDIDSSASGARKYTDVANQKVKQGATSREAYGLWLYGKIGSTIYSGSSLAAAAAVYNDGLYNDTPNASPSNVSVPISSACLEDGTDVTLTLEQANILNANGICTALKFMNGFVAWGNYTACYPSNTDVKDYFIPVSRMFGWVGNSLVKTFWSKLDKPMTRRLIDTVLDSANIWLNGLVGMGYLLGARVEMLENENPLTNLMAGIIKLHVYMTPPSPAQEIDFVLEYDASYVTSALQG